MSKKEKGRKWDGKSRVVTDLYRQRWKDIFGKDADLFDKVTDDNAEEFVHNQDKENEEYLKELKKKL
tara:strand:- start:339 stop:539 length:201 start_codon:yes stop_codon:yes gene_type:complete